MTSPSLLGELTTMLASIERNYHREGSGPASRFEGQTLEAVQAQAVLTRVRDWDERHPKPAQATQPQAGDRVYQLVDADGTVLGEDPAVQPGATPQLPATDTPCGIRRSTPQGVWQRGAWYPMGHPDPLGGVAMWPDERGDSWLPLCKVLTAVGIDQQTLVSNSPDELARIAVDLIEHREGVASVTKLAQAMASAGTGIMADLHLHPQTKQAARQLLREMADMLGRE